MNERLRALLLGLRSRANIGRAELADRLGVSEKTVKNWEYGSRSPGVDDLARWLDHVGATPDERLQALDLAKGGSAVRAVA